MALGEALALVGAGVVAGTSNAIVGAGSLVTFPTLLALGYPPVLANVSNTIALVPGGVSGVIGYRRELVGQKERILRLSAAAVSGGLTGGALLLVLPGSVFEGVVPVLILVAVGLVLAQPRLARRMAARPGPTPIHGGPWLVLGVFTTGIYGGYFGAAQGVILIALLGIFVDDSLQRLNAAKNLVALLVNGASALLFVVLADVAWSASAWLALGAIAGGQLGAAVGRRIPARGLRIVIAVVGTFVAVRLLLG